MRNLSMVIGALLIAVGAAGRTVLAAEPTTQGSDMLTQYTQALKEHDLHDSHLEVAAFWSVSIVLLVTCIIYDNRRNWIRVKHWQDHIDRVEAVNKEIAEQNKQMIALLESIRDKMGKGM